MVLKDLRDARQVAYAAVPQFPGRGRVRAGRAAVHGGVRGRAGEHARDCWDRERELLARRASGLERDAGGRAGLVAVVELEFLGALGRHVVWCARTEDGCADWLAWGVGAAGGGLAQMFRAVGGEWQQVPPGYARALAAVWRET
jgi:hypothetical protein